MSRDEQADTDLHGRLAWLGRARSESQTLAERRAEHVPPLSWEDQRRERSAPLPWLVWVSASLALTLGLASATLAYVHHRRQSRAAEAQARPATRPAAPPKTVAPRRSAAGRVSPVVAAEPSTPTRAAKPRRVPGGAERSPSSQPVAAQPAASEKVIFGAGEVEGGEVIMVSPPRKLEPLWTPEAYKRGGRTGTRY